MPDVIDERDRLLQWLSVAEVPPIRYLVARDLGYPQNSVLSELRSAIFDWEPLRTILALQESDGGFPNQTKTTTGAPTLAALTIMSRCGLGVEDECVARALAYVSQRRLHDGVFTVRGKGSGVLPCYVGMFTRLVAELAGTDHPLYRSGVEWIVEYQRFDHKDTKAGGSGHWPYKSVVNYGGCWNSVTCYHSIGPTLRALSVLQRDQRSEAVQNRIEAALEYLRIHRVFKKSHEDKALFRNSTKLYLFGGYRSNLLDILEGIAEANPTAMGEEWVSSAVEAVLSQAVDGKICATTSYSTELDDPLLLEPDGPSRFLTYQWEKIRQATTTGIGPRSTHTHL